MGSAGAGTLMVVIAMFLDDGYWFLVTGSVFVLLGVITFLYLRMRSWPSD
jgi:hypothetical protein